MSTETPFKGKDVVASLKEIRKIIECIFSSDMPPTHKLFAFFMLLLTVASCSIVYMCAKTGNYLWASLLGIAAIISVLILSLIIALPFLRKMERNATPKWERLIPNLPMKSSNSRKLAQLVEDTRKSALAFLSTHKTDIKDNHIRANIFFPSRKQVSNGILCTLTMPGELSSQMHNSKERAIQLLPGQGATGVAYVEGIEQIAIYNDDSQSWDREYQLTDRQQQQIDDNLKWVVSMPLKHTRTGEVVAVLNVDGLYDTFDDSLLTQMMLSLVKHIQGVASFISKRSMTNLVVLAEE